MINSLLALNSHEVLHSGINGFGQASVSTLLTMLVGCVIAIGLVGWSRPKSRIFLQMFIALPNFVPVLFVVMSYLMWSDWLRLPFEDGFWAVVLVHVLLSAGFAGFLLYQQLGQNILSSVELAMIEGAGRFKIWVNIFRASKTSILVISLGFFALFFSSFSVPLLVGGQKIWSFEILAYKYFSGQGNLLAAALVGFLQMIIFGAMVFYAKGFKSHSGDLRARNLPQAIGYSPFLLIGLLCTICAFSGSFFGAEKAFQQIGAIVNELPKLLLSSLVISFGVGFLSLGLYLVLVFFALNNGLNLFVKALGMISTVVLGLAFYLIPISITLKLIVGMSFLFFPSVYRFVGSNRVEQLKSQLETAKILGGGPGFNFLKISLPLSLSTGLKLAAIAAFWAVGEYGYSSVVTGEVSNLALLSKNLLGGYRLELASLIVLLSLLTGLSVFALFWSLSHVCRQKFNS